MFIMASSMRWAGRMACMGDKRGAYTVLMGMLERERERERETTWNTRRRWKDNIKTDLKDVGWGGMDWIDLASYRDWWRALVNAAMNLRVP